MDDLLERVKAVLAACDKWDSLCELEGFTPEGKLNPEEIRLATICDEEVEGWLRALVARVEEAEAVLRAMCLNPKAGEQDLIEAGKNFCEEADEILADRQKRLEENYKLKAEVERLRYAIECATGRTVDEVLDKTPPQPPAAPGGGG